MSRSTHDPMQRLADEHAALRRVATLVAREASQAEIFSAIAEESGRLIGAQAIRMLRYERDETALVVASWGVDGDVFPRVGYRAKLGGDNATTRVFRTGEPVRIDDYEEASGPIGDAVKAASPLRSSVATPIVVEGRTWGVVIAGTSGTEPMAPDTESRLTQFSDLVATAIANAQSREALAELADEQAALRRVATLVAQDVGPSEIFAAVAEEVAGLFQTTGAVLRFEEGGRAAVMVGSANVDIPLGVRLEFEEGMGPIEVYRTGRSARIDHVNVDHTEWSSDEGSVVATAGHLGLVSSVVSPIAVEGRTWGVIGVSSTEEPLPLETESRLEKFTMLVATAIANAESREALSQLATEQAGLRRVATLVAEGAPAAELFSAVTKEVARVFAEVDPSLVASVIRFDPGPESVLVGASRAYEREPVGSRWVPKELYVSTRVLRTGRSARVDEAELDAAGGPDADVLRLRGFLYQLGSPVSVEGRLWGAMTLNSKEALPPDTDQRLASFVELIATAIANAESRSELAASRKRLVAASDEARRRIERDLHDGTQQRLVSLALAARAAASELPEQSGEVREKLSSIASGLGEAVEDLQELSRGIHPAILSDAGLAPALEALALRSAIPVELDVRTRERFSEPIEVAAYFVASESLANAAKHSQASRIDVVLGVDDDELRLSIRDDGVGGVDPGRGSGLLGLRDRVEALGGTLGIESASGRGTALSATLPVGDEAGDPAL